MINRQNQTNPAPPAAAMTGGGGKTVGHQKGIGSAQDATRSLIKFERRYCPAVYPDLKGLIEHFESAHRRSSEYVEIPVPEELADGRL